MAASTSVAITRKTQKAFIEYYKSIQNMQNTSRSDLRAKFEFIDRLYQRERDHTQEHTDAVAANNAGDSTRHRNITVPVVMPQVESAVTYQASVFLTGHPIFGVVAAPQHIDAALQMESIIEDQATRGGWARELILFFRDGFKYNFAPVEIDWGEEVTYHIDSELDTSLEEGIAKKVIWSGNRVKRLDPYNMIIDSRVPPTELHKRGEFAGYTELLSRIDLKSYVASLPNHIIANIKPAFESGLGSGSGAKDSNSQNFYLPDINPLVKEENYRSQTTNWLKWAGIDRDWENRNFEN